jgi:hypothetical protein
LRGWGMVQATWEENGENERERVHESERGSA